MAVMRIMDRSLLLVMDLVSCPFFYASTTLSPTYECPNDQVDFGVSMKVPHGIGITNDMLFNVRPNDTFDLHEQWETYNVQNFPITFQDVIA